MHFISVTLVCSSLSSRTSKPTQKIKKKVWSNSFDISFFFNSVIRFVDSGNVVSERVYPTGNFFCFLLFTFEKKKVKRKKRNNNINKWKWMTLDTQTLADNNNASAGQFLFKIFFFFFSFSSLFGFDTLKNLIWLQNGQDFIRQWYVTMSTVECYLYQRTRRKKEKKWNKMAK